MDEGGGKDLDVEESAMWICMPCYSYLTTGNRGNSAIEQDFRDRPDVRYAETIKPITAYGRDGHGKEVEIRIDKVRPGDQYGHLRIVDGFVRDHIPLFAEPFLSDDERKKVTDIIQRVFPDCSEIEIEDCEEDEHSTRRTIFSFNNNRPTTTEDVGITAGLEMRMYRLISEEFDSERESMIIVSSW